MEKVLSFLSMEVFEVKLYYLGLSFLFVFAGFLFKALFQLFSKKIIIFTKKTKFSFDDIVAEALSKPISWMILIIFLYFSTLFLPIPEEPMNVKFFINSLFKSFITIISVWAALRLLKGVTEKWQESSGRISRKIDDQLILIIRSSGKVFIIAIGLVVFLQNFGYSVSSLIAGLGIGGAAIAFASKDALANIFGSFVVFLDRPFLQGDYITIDEVEGTVEDIGVRTTRIRTLANSLVTIPNSDFTVKSIINWSRRMKRQINLNIGVTYSSKPEEIEKLVSAIKDTIRNNSELYDDGFIVSLNNFGPSSLDIFINCYTRTVIWKEYHEVKERFMLELMKNVSDCGLSFAFPTQTLHIEKC